MKTSRIQSLILLVVATALLLGFVVPSVAGQTVPVACDAIAVSTIELGGASTEPIEPGSQANVSVQWEYRAPAQAFSLSPIRLEFFTLGGTSWMQTSLSPNVVFVAVPLGEETNEQGELQLTILISEDAPAGGEGALSVAVEAEEGTCVTATEGESPQIIVRVSNDESAEAGEAGADDSQDPLDEAAIPSVPLMLVVSAAMGLLMIGRRRSA